MNYWNISGLTSGDLGESDDMINEREKCYFLDVIKRGGDVLYRFGESNAKNINASLVSANFFLHDQMH